MSQKGNTQVTFIFTSTPDQVAEGDRIFASHAEWLEQPIIAMGSSNC